VRAVDDVGRDATRSGLCGLATCFGATTVMEGSEAPEPVAVCDIAVPLRPHTNAVDKMAIAEGATMLDEDLMTLSSQIPAQKNSISVQSVENMLSYFCMMTMLSN
jgi:hypothetical protein